MVEGSNSCWVILQTTLWQRLQRLRIKLARFLPWCYAMTSGKRFEVVKSSFITIFINSGKVAIETNGSLNWISICFHIIIMNKMAYCSFGSCFQLFFFSFAWNWIQMRKFSFEFFKHISYFMLLTDTDISLFIYFLK